MRAAVLPLVFVLTVASLSHAAAPGHGTSTGDVNGDGRADLVWRHATGANVLWLMSGAQIASEVALPSADVGWRLRAVSDFNGDGRADLLWYRDDSGSAAVWLLDAAGRVTSAGLLRSAPDTDWRIAAVGDFDGDGHSDLFWRHRVRGANAVWFVRDGRISSIAGSKPAALTWEVAGAGDLNGDGRTDIVWFDPATGTSAAWLMNGAQPSGAAILQTVVGSWKVAAVADIDADARADILWRHTTTGQAAVWRMSGTTVRNAALIGSTTSTTWQIDAVGDLNGDRRADIVWRNLSTGTVAIWMLDDSRVAATGVARTLPDTGWAPPTDGSGPAARLYIASLTAEGGTATSASGFATLVLAADERSARLTLDFDGLSTGETAAHVHGPASSAETAPAVYSLPLGTFTDLLWVFQPTAALTVQDTVAALKTGRLYVNVHSEMAPGGEIRGHFRPAPGTLPPPPPPLPSPPGPPTVVAAGRFLDQATFGATPELIQQVRSQGYEAFLEQQFAATPSFYASWVASLPDHPDDTRRSKRFRAHFFNRALRGPDQLRQRVAFALSQILVASGMEVNDGGALATYYDVLVQHAFGNYRQLLEAITLNPTMGEYLNTVDNMKPIPAIGRTANENYARELMQLFSIGVFEMHENGNLRLTRDGRPIATYDQSMVEGMARAFTGWSYAPAPGTTPQNHNPPYYLAPMVLWAANHDTDSKRILGGRVLPAGQTGLKDIRDTLDTVFQHPNVGPFVSRRLIQHLVTSNPTPGYVARVTALFNDNGLGVRGDLRAVVRAILLDPEARGEQRTDAAFGHLQEPAVFATRFVRRLGIAGDGYGLWERTGWQMDQNPFFAPSVFNFYGPDHLVPGTVLHGPEFEIYSENAAVWRANFVHIMGNNAMRLPPYAPAGTAPFVLDLGPWDALATNPTALVDALGLRLLDGTMDAAMRQEIIQAVASIPERRLDSRTRAAIYLIAASPRFSVVR